MGVKVRVKRNIGKYSEGYFGLPNGKVYELTDNFRLVDDGGYEWGYDGFKDEQEFIKHMKNVCDSSTEFEVVREKSKWKCVELNKTSGFTKGKIYEVEGNGTIYYDDGNESSEKLLINGNKAECWQAKFEKVEEEVKLEEEKVVNKFKVGDIIKGKIGSKKRYVITNEYMTRGEVVKVNDDDEIKVKILEHAKYNREIGYKYDVEPDYFELVTQSSHKKSIHITFDGNTTHAVVKEDGKVVKREKVGLYSGDVYDEATGVREVIDKLYGKKVEMKPREFKVGDKVKILDGSGIDNYCGGWTEFMKDDVGKIATIKTFDSVGSIDGVRFKEFCHIWDLRGIRLVSEAPIKTPPSEYTIDELLTEIKKRMER